MIRSSRFFSFILLLLVSLMALAGCQDEGAEPADVERLRNRVQALEAQLQRAEPTATTVAQSTDGVPTGNEITVAAADLLSEFNAAVDRRDGPGLYNLLVQDIREVCGPPQIIEVIESEAKFPEAMEVDEVYIDPDDPSRALVRWRLEDVEEGGLPEALASVVLSSFPWPVSKEKGEWKLGFPRPSGLNQTDCPLAVEGGPTSSDVPVSTPTPLEVEAGPLPNNSLLVNAAPEGVEVVQATEDLNQVTGEGPLKHGFTASLALVESDLEPLAMLEEYVQGIKQPDWNQNSKRWGEDGASISWLGQEFDRSPGVVVAYLSIVRESDNRWWVRYWEAIGGPIGAR